MTALRDLTQEPPFGRLTVIKRGPNKGGRVYWLCDCSCGNRCLVASNMLCAGETRSCGCLNKELSRQRRQTHGMTHTPEYITWLRMRERCFDHNHPKYRYYGGRGITVCEQWRDSFQAFFQDVGPRPAPGYTLERKDKDGSYVPDNCIWATWITQGRNRHNNRLITLNGVTQCLAAWLDILPVSRATYNKRRQHGWSIEDALMAPVQAKYSPKHRGASSV